MNRTLRILHVAPTPFFSDRGCHIRISGIISGLNDLNLENRLCTYPLGNDQKSIDTVRCLPVPGYSKTVAGPSVFKVILDPLLVLTVASQIRKFKPDILHCHLHEGVLVGWLARYLAFKPNLKIGFDVQGGLVSELQSYGHLKLSLLSRLVIWLETFVISRADAYFCSSRASFRLFADEFRIDSNELHLVPDGADVVVADRGENDVSEVTALPIAVYAGGLTGSKGVEALQDVVRISAERNLGLKFKIIGYPTEEFQSFLNEHGIKNCDLLGRVPFESLSNHLSTAVVALEPKSANTSEASGKLLNYMAARLPIVCFDTDNNRNMLKDSGYYAQSDNPHSLVDQLECVLQDLNLASDRGYAGYERVKTAFSWRSSAKTILSSYERLLGSRQKTPLS